MIIIKIINNYILEKMNKSWIMYDECMVPSKLI